MWPQRPGCIGGHNWTAYGPGRQFGYSGLGTAMHARERAMPMRYNASRMHSVKYTPLYAAGLQAYFTGLHLTGLYLTGLHFTGLHLTGLHLTGMHVTGRHLSQARTRIVSPADKPSNCVP
jgi:hypothetical protein